jgi:hypothetical protein
LEQLTNIRQGMPLNPLANKYACNRIIQRYNEDGRPFASCTLIKGGQEGDTEVIFNITEGPKVKVRAIDFTGNTFVSAAVLRNRINGFRTSLNLIGDTYNAAMVENTVQELLRYYKSFGYHDVKIDHEVVSSSESCVVKLIFHIHEGVRHRRVSLEELDLLGGPKGGEVEGPIKGDADRMRAWIGWKESESGKASESYDENQPGLIRVNLEKETSEGAGAESTGKEPEASDPGDQGAAQGTALLDPVPMNPAPVLLDRDLEQAKRNLARINLFAPRLSEALWPSAMVLDNPLDADNPVLRILDPDLKASVGFFRLGVSADSGLTGTIVLNERTSEVMPQERPAALLKTTSFWRTVEKYRIAIGPDTRFKRYAASFSRPFRFDVLHRRTPSGFRDTTFQEASTGNLMFGIGVNADTGLTGSIILNERVPVPFDW